MNAEDLKKYISEDTERIEKVLESIGCHGMWRSRGEVRCASPDSQNTTEVSVNIDTLFCRHYKQGETFRGDLISFVQQIRKESFTDSFRYLKALFGLSGGYKKDTRNDPLKLFKSIRKGVHTIHELGDREIPKFGMEALDEFDLIPHINLFKEGITPQTAELFKTGYDTKLDRIIFPHFHYDDINSIVGITGRTLRSAEEIKEFKVPKYWNYIKGYLKTSNLYAFSHAIEYIKSNKMIIIAEAEKSVLKHFSMTRNQGFTVSTGGHDISPEQVQIILQNTPMDVEVVVAFDKDIMHLKNDDGKDIGEEYLIEQCHKFSKYRKTSYIYDTYNILEEKASPYDQGVKIFNHLLKFRKQL